VTSATLLWIAVVAMLCHWSEHWWPVLLLPLAGAWEGLFGKD